MSEPQIAMAFEPHISSTIDPIPANPLRKRAMREEFLAHLVGAYEEELINTPCRHDAIAAARARFGDLDALREQLRQSVPPVERLIFQLFTTRESPMLRWIFVGIACFAIGMAMILPSLAKIKEGGKFTAVAAAPGAIGLVIVLATLVISVYKICRKLAHGNTISRR